MATLTIKGMPDPLYERLKESAAASHRSLNSEVIARLEQAVGSPRLGREELLARVRAVRERMGDAPLTDAWLREARDEGRP
jgi:plasmid stability protein